MPRKYTKAGLSWLDVEEAIRDLQKEYQVHAVLEIRTEALGFLERRGLQVLLSATAVAQGGTLGGTRSVRRNWPTYGSRTMPGFILALIHELKESLEARPIDLAKQQKRFAYPAG